MNCISIKSLLGAKVRLKTVSELNSIGSRHIPGNRFYTVGNVFYRVSLDGKTRVLVYLTELGRDQVFGLDQLRYEENIM